ncbi:MAG: hypothetical protein SOZ01_10420 [Selenomonadaceae bacterium]|nr:hypothetical protein [Selenomonadaceae bacterium]MDD7055593.1 hypothetical protein [Selenomonadaceae bacterium]MDY3917113.1 hypothetical protein [Selenomonadaceae bacterium]
MTFILAAAGIMAITIFVIDYLCQHFGIGLKRSSLVLCALVSFAINGAIILISPYLDRSHYLRLGGLVLIAAGCVTLYNERLLRREAAQAAKATKAAEPAPVVQAVKATEPEASTETVPAKPAEEFSAAPGPVPEVKHEATVKSAPDVEPKPEPAVKPAPKAEPKPEPMAKPAQKAEPKPEPTAKPAPKPKQNPAPVQKPQPVRLPEPAAAFAARIGAADSLDALLDIAYADKLAQGDALYLYQQATARYAGDDYWPFLVVELANIYKDCAAYDAAINTYEKALQQPMIAGNTVMAAKFQETLDYLRRVQHILAKHHAEATPFPEIPADWLQAAEQADLHGQA